MSFCGTHTHFMDQYCLNNKNKKDKTSTISWCECAFSSSPHVISSTLNCIGVRVYEYWAFGLQDCSSGCGFGGLALGLSSFYMAMWLNVTFNSLHILLSFLFRVVFSRTLYLVGGDNSQIVKWSETLSYLGLSNIE